jgi:O-methyltransferase involved in polyketide biosynthesis
MIRVFNKHAQSDSFPIEAWHAEPLAAGARLPRAALRSLVASARPRGASGADAHAVSMLRGLPARDGTFGVSSLARASRRTHAIDDFIVRFVEATPHARVVSIGSFLSTRSHRLGPPCMWIDVDSPAIAAARRSWLPARDLHFQVATDLDDLGFIQQVIRTQLGPVLVLLEDAWLDASTQALRSVFHALGEVVAPGTDLLLTVDRVGQRTWPAVDLAAEPAWRASFVDPIDGFILFKRA